MAFNFDEQSVRRIARTVIHSERMLRGGGDAPGIDGAVNQVWWPFRNDYAGTVPAYGVVAITGITVVQGLPIYTGTRPSTTFYRVYGINSAEAVPDDGYGQLRLTGPCEIAYDSGTPAAGEGWGPKPSQFTLSKGYPSITTVSGVIDSTNKVLLGTLGPINILIGKLAEACSVGETNVDVDIWASDTEADTTINLNVNDWLMKSGATDIASGKKVVCQWINNKWYITEAECA